MPTEPLTLEAQEMQRQAAEEALCESGHHTPHELWDWRCARCDFLLCLTCTEEIDRCTCEGGPSHG